MVEGFFPSAVLFALLKLNVFERIGAGPKGVDDLAAEIGARPDTLARLLNAGVALGLLDPVGDAELSVPEAFRPVLLPSDEAHYLGDWMRAMDYFRAAMTGLDEAVLRSGPTIDPSTHSGADSQATRDFILAMHNYASFGGRDLADALDASGCRTMLDLGCGPGTYAFHLGLRNPALKLCLLDSPEVLAIAAEVRTRFDLENEVEFLPLNMVDDEIPGSYDLILASNVLHVLGEATSRDLVKRLYGSVNAGGSLVVQARFLPDDGVGSQPALFLDLLQLAITEAGRNHSVAETRTWLEEAGFTRVEFGQLSLLNANSFLRGYRP